MRKIAIIGATSHIARNIIDGLIKNNLYKLSLYCRSIDKMRSILYEQKISESILVINGLDKINKSQKHDLIINCIGITDGKVLKESPESIFSLTEKYDELILKLCKKNNSRYINLSSGAVYGERFENPVNHQTEASIPVNSLNEKYFYGIAKLNSEAKHRSLKNLSIIDLRIFGFVSRYIDLSKPYLFCDIVNAIKDKKVFKTNSENIYRDYIHPEDLMQIINLIINYDKPLNAVFDVYSAAPINKMELLKNISEKYKMKYKIIDSNIASVTGVKPRYYSEDRRLSEIGYNPVYTSLEAILSEGNFLLGE